MKTFARCLAVVGISAGVLTAAQAAPVTAFYYTSSPSSWVGQGATVTVTPADGFAFSANPTFDKGVSLGINDFQSNPDFQKARWWYLEFAAPFDALLSVGFYDNAMRWPFQDSDRPGLSFSGNGRGNNTLTGFFEVLEVAFDQAGSILRFAADFTQFDEGNEQAWNRGSIRFNSEIPLFPNTVPEPGTTLLLLSVLAALSLGALRRRPLMLKRALSVTAAGIAVAFSAASNAAYVDAQGNLWRSLTETTQFTWNTIDAVCPNDGITPCSGSVNGYDFSGLVWATQDQVRQLMAGFGVNVPLQGNIGEIDSTWAPAFQAAFGVTHTTGVFSLDSKGWSSTSGEGIYASGALVGEIWNRPAGFYDVAGFTGLWKGAPGLGAYLFERPTAVPEPSTAFAVMAVALAGAWVRRRRSPSSKVA